MDEGKSAVKSKLKDPSSAKFKGVYFNNIAIPVTCGKVNSKNSFGAYAGYEKFVSAGSAELTFLASQVADFSVVWNKFCRK